MADTVYRYQVDGTLSDANGKTVALDGSFQVDYTTGTISNVDISGYNVGSLSSSRAQDGTTEYTATFGYFPQGPYLINSASVSYDTMNPGLADSASETSGANPNPYGIAVGSDTYSAQNVPLAAVAISVCYVAGTSIRTVAGDVVVEDLTIGDLVVTASGAHRPIRWLGHRRYAGRFANANPNLLPVCFKAGSLAKDVPTRDLWVSPKHAMFLDGALVPAEHLVNGVTIVKAAHVERVDYHHVELDSHDVLLANGAPSESFVDDEGRAIFHNAHEHAALYPDAVPTEAAYCAPRIESGYRLEAIRRGLAARAGLASGVAFRSAAGPCLAIRE